MLNWHTGTLFFKTNFSIRRLQQSTKYDSHKRHPRNNKAKQYTTDRAEEGGLFRVILIRLYFISLTVSENDFYERVRSSTPLTETSFII
jgi:hypothetical protein